MKTLKILLIGLTPISLMLNAYLYYCLKASETLIVGYLPFSPVEIEDVTQCNRMLQSGHSPKALVAKADNGYQIAFSGALNEDDRNEITNQIEEFINERIEDREK